MHISRLDLNLLVVFDTVFAEGGITPASRKLNLAQPAVSHALGRLREVFGEPLFVRQGRGVAPTPLARSIAGPVREALASMQRTLDTAGRFDPRSAARNFRVGLREALEPGVLPPLAVAFAEAGPGLTLATARHDRSLLERELESGEFDVALDVLLPLADRTPHELVLSDRLVIVARRDHPALMRGARPRATLALDEYLALQHVQVSSRRRGATFEDTALRPLDRQRDVRLRCQSHAAACRIAAQTDLIVTMPETHARQVTDAAVHCMLPVPLDGLELETYMYWAAGATGDAANRWLRERMRGALQPLRTQPRAGSRRRDRR